jgi:hypothetical protein
LGKAEVYCVWGDKIAFISRNEKERRGILGRKHKEGGVMGNRIDGTVSLSDGGKSAGRG